MQCAVENTAKYLQNFFRAQYLSLHPVNCDLTWEKISTSRISLVVVLLVCIVFIRCAHIYLSRVHIACGRTNGRAAVWLCTTSG